MAVISFYKKVGETPLQALDRLRQEQSQFSQSKMTYVGRLDPLAEGKLLILTDDTCYEREKYLGLDKTYIVDVVIGISTDTGDVLGKITESSAIENNCFENIEKNSVALVGEREQFYPLYSSKPYKGRPLFEYARAGQHIIEAERPKHVIKVYSINFIKSYILRTNEFWQIVQNDIHSVIGNFRQEEIVSIWQEFFRKNSVAEWHAIQVKVHCSSGTYMRVLAEEMGALCKLPALALHIKREKIHFK